MTIYVPGKLTLSKIQQYPAVIGEPWGGGYFAGYISHTADGNPTHALIVAPAATGATGGAYPQTTFPAWKTTSTTTIGTTSDFDGVANTAAIVTAGIADHPAAQFCTNLTIGGFTDWYLPSVLELDIAYFNLKPTTQANDSSFGINNYSVPKRIINNTTNYPSITSVTAFATSAEGFIADRHWSSTEASTTNAKQLTPSTGKLDNSPKTTGLYVRAFRRIALP